jgi:hypothetical protein
MKVITLPYDAQAVPLSVAQRASILVTARNDTEADQHDWPLFANMNPDMFDTVRAITLESLVRDSQMPYPKFTCPGAGRSAIE